MHFKIASNSVSSFNFEVSLPSSVRIHILTLDGNEISPNGFLRQKKRIRNLKSKSTLFMNPIFLSIIFIMTFCHVKQYEIILSQHVFVDRILTEKKKKPISLYISLTISLCSEY